MSKKKNNSNISKLFNSKVDIMSNDNSIYHIRKSRVYIRKSNYYGKIYTISSNKYNKNNVHIIREFYDNEDDRLRFRMCRLTNVTKFKTIEKLPNGTERKIAVIDNYDESSEYICSIGNIKKIETDKITEINDNKLSNHKILKLILPKEYFNREEENKKIA